MSGRDPENWMHHDRDEARTVRDHTIGVCDAQPTRDEIHPDPPRAPYAERCRFCGWLTPGCDGHCIADQRPARLVA